VVTKSEGASGLEFGPIRAGLDSSLPTGTYPLLVLACSTRQSFLYFTAKRSIRLPYDGLFCSAVFFARPGATAVTAPNDRPVPLPSDACRAPRSTVPTGVADGLISVPGDRRCTRSSSRSARLRRTDSLGDGFKEGFGPRSPASFHMACVDSKA